MAVGGLAALVPDVVAGEADVLPAKRRDVLHDIRAQWLSIPPKALERSGEVARIPEDDRRDQ